MLTRNSLFVVALASCLAVNGQAEPNGVQGAEGKPAMKRVLILGNSITHHGPSEKVSWTGNWGMAASCAEKDYVHLLIDGLTERLGERPETMVKNIASFEREYATFDIEKGLRKEIDFAPDTVVLAIAENVPAPKTPEEQKSFRDALVRLLGALKAKSNPTFYVRSSFWANSTKDDILKDVCNEFGGVFVDIGALGKDEKNFARSEREYEHKGVAAHPGDRGMKAIADAILNAMDASRQSPVQ